MSKLRELIDARLELKKLLDNPPTTSLAITQRGGRYHFDPLALRAWGDHHDRQLEIARERVKKAYAPFKAIKKKR